MGALAKIHQEVVDVLKKKFTLDRVQLKHRLPVRPIRMLGLIGMDGEVYKTASRHVPSHFSTGLHEGLFYLPVCQG